MTRRSKDWVRRDVLYSRFMNYCATHDCPILSITKVSTFLRNLGVQEKARVNSKVNKMYAYTGLRNLVERESPPLHLAPSHLDTPPSQVHFAPRKPRSEYSRKRVSDLSKSLPSFFDIPLFQSSRPSSKSQRWSWHSRHHSPSSLNDVIHSPSSPQRHSYYDSNSSLRPSSSQWHTSMIGEGMI